MSQSNRVLGFTKKKLEIMPKIPVRNCILLNGKVNIKIYKCNMRPTT